MSRVVAAGVVTKFGSTGFAPPRLEPDALLRLVHGAQRICVVWQLRGLTETSTFGHAGAVGVAAVREQHQASATAWGPLFRFHYPERMTRATTSTATTVSTLQGLLRSERNDERLRRMTPERRALYRSIVALRQTIGRVDFDVTELVREVRDSA